MTTGFQETLARALKSQIDKGSLELCAIDDILLNGNAI